MEVSAGAAQGRRELGRNGDSAAGYRYVLGGGVANWGMNWGTAQAAAAPTVNWVANTRSQSE
jgi:hypothetical protein